MSRPSKCERENLHAAAEELYRHGVQRWLQRRDAVSHLAIDFQTPNGKPRTVVVSSSGTDNARRQIQRAVRKAIASAFLKMVLTLT